MNITAAMRLVPEKVQADKPQEMGTLDLLALVASLAPLSPPGSIAEAVAQRKEYEAEEKRKEQAVPMAQKILKAMQLRVIAKEEAEAAKEEAEEEVMDRVAAACRTELLAGLRSIGGVVARAGVRILVWAASATISAIGGVISFLIANPLVAAAIGLAALGYAGYKYYFNRKEVEGTINTDSASTYSVSSSEVKAATGVESKEVAKAVQTPPPKEAQAPTVVASPAPAPVSAPKPTTTAEAARTAPLPTVAAKEEAKKEEAKPSASAAQIKKKQKEKKKFEISQEVKDAIANASRVVGVPASLLTALAGVESSFGNNTTASTSSAKGLFQFIKDTWKGVLKNYGKQYGVPDDADPYDNKWSAIMAAAMIKHEGWPAVAKVVPNPSITDIYLTHLLGPSGGARFLRGYVANPNVDATTLVGADQVASNAPIFVAGERNRTAKEVYDLFASRLGAQLKKGEEVVAHAEATANGPVVAQAKAETPEAAPQQVAESGAAKHPVGAPSSSPGSYEYVKIGPNHSKVRTA